MYFLVLGDARHGLHGNVNNMLLTAKKTSMDTLRAILYCDQSCGVLVKKFEGALHCRTNLLLTHGAFVLTRKWYFW